MSRRTMHLLRESSMGWVMQRSWRNSVLILLWKPSWKIPSNISMYLLSWCYLNCIESSKSSEQHLQIACLQWLQWVRDLLFHLGSWYAVDSVCVLKNCSVCICLGLPEARKSRPTSLSPLTLNDSKAGKGAYLSWASTWVQIFSHVDFPARSLAVFVKIKW